MIITQSRLLVIYVDLGMKNRDNILSQNIFRDFHIVLKYLERKYCLSVCF